MHPSRIHVSAAALPTLAVVALLAVVSLPTVRLIADSQAPCTVAAAGDIAEANGDQAATAQLVESLHPTAVLTLGDNAYEDGSDADFRRYYDPTWGRFKDVTHPTVGNHEYNTPGAAGYFSYFHVPPYYAFDLCGWRLYALNREIDGDDRAKEMTWLRSDLAAHHGRPMLAYWHEPRWTSGTRHGSDAGADDLWRAVVTAGVALVLNGHEHSYERLAPLGTDGKPKDGGTREIVVGEGGNPDLYGMGDPLPGSQVRVTGQHGVLALTLHPDGYDWQLHQVGGAIADHGHQQVTGRSRPRATPSASLNPGPTAHHGPPGAETTPTPATPATTPPTASIDSPTPTPASDGTDAPSGTATRPAGTTTGSWSPLATPAPGPANATHWWVRAAQATYVQSRHPDTVFAGATELQVDSDGPTSQTFLTFDLSGLPTTAHLSGYVYLWTTTDLPRGADVAWSPSTWSAPALTWSHRPAASAPPLAHLPATASGHWVSVDVTTGLRAGGPVSLTVTGSHPGHVSAAVAGAASAAPPTLYLTVASPPSPQG